MVISASAYGNKQTCKKFGFFFSRKCKISYR